MNLWRFFPRLRDLRWLPHLWRCRFQCTSNFGRRVRTRVTNIINYNNVLIILIGYWLPWITSFGFIFLSYHFIQRDILSNKCQVLLSMVITNYACHLPLTHGVPKLQQPLSKF
ncbi:hypothetical protein JHK82_035113 [Glycine max]|uniref:Uncharacterized protein n=2 Tax=Glycine subgen. Soja TaxID=1462606 RepID=I1JFU1_SOYBN|nr:hypothetical protein JHK87_035048 [Glycine soja]KAG4969421.1 hypothetical protein JHK85_035842 [Glycine max]KAG4975760.1 hypothetical protein JHK86_035234 [Glycine max]KAG5111844.1 hypothetical protein JHK82_035113 [Glycine max]KAG5129116.1 hypothetical protein JHK84_035513 [Glycine max]